jgi:predicted nucleic acid-binding protein
VILLDTNILIDLDLYVFDPEEEYGASILSRAELEYGIHTAKSPHDAAERTRRLLTCTGVQDRLLFCEVRGACACVLGH